MADMKGCAVCTICSPFPVAVHSNIQDAGTVRRRHHEWQGVFAGGGVYPLPLLSWFVPQKNRVNGLQFSIEIHFCVEHWVRFVPSVRGVFNLEFLLSRNPAANSRCLRISQPTARVAKTCLAIVCENERGCNAEATRDPTLAVTHICVCLVAAFHDYLLCRCLCWLGMRSV